MIWSGASHVAAAGLLCLYQPATPPLPPVRPPSARVLLTAPPRLPDAPRASRVDPRAKLEIAKPREAIPEAAKIEKIDSPSLKLDFQPAAALPLEQPKLAASRPKAVPELAAATASAPRPRPAVVKAAGFEGAPIQAKGPSAKSRLEVGAFQGLTGAPGGSPGAGRQAEVRQAGFGGTLAARAEGKPGPTVGASGFGGASAASARRTEPASVTAGFGQVRSEKAAAPVKQQEARKVTPVEILSKPKPAYSAEARERRIEGEVVLNVRFGADGRLEVLRVARGLGHGLDEAAVAAVAAMAFRPALRDGTAVDAVLSVSVAFRLAY